MPTFDAENQVRFSKESRPFVAVSRNGELVPEAKQVIALAAKYRLTLETGHPSPAEGLMIIREARRQGVEHIVVTHAMLAPVRMNIAQIRESATLGAYIEFVYNGLFGPEKQYEARDYANAMRAIGAKSVLWGATWGRGRTRCIPMRWPLSSRCCAKKAWRRRISI